MPNHSRARTANAERHAGASKLLLAPVADAAEFGAVSPKTIRRMVSRGELTAYRLGPRLLRIDLNELNAALRVVPSADGAA